MKKHILGCMDIPFPGGIKFLIPNFWHLQPQSWFCWADHFFITCSSYKSVLWSYHSKRQTITHFIALLQVWILNSNVFLKVREKWDIWKCGTSKTQARPEGVQQDLKQGHLLTSGEMDNSCHVEETASALVELHFCSHIPQQQLELKQSKTNKNPQLFFCFM